MTDERVNDLLAKARDADIVATAAHKRGDYTAYLDWASRCTAFHKQASRRSNRLRALLVKP